MPDTPNPVLITDAATLVRTCAAFRRARRVAVDTEAASFHRYVDRVYLLQLSTDTDTVLVDPLAVADLRPVGHLLSDPAVETIFHDADYDLRVLDRDYRFRAARIFDTRVAAQLAGEPSVGLGALLDKYLGIRLDKRFQRADWSVRPLPPDMIQYAADDTRYLPTLRDRLAARLQEIGRRTWAEEEFARLEATRWTKERDSEDAFLRIKGAKALSLRQRAVLRAVHRWRDGLARELDRAPFRVLPNETLVALARRQPRSEVELTRVSGLSHHRMDRYGQSLLEAISVGLQASLDTVPEVRRHARPERDAGYDARLERLRALRAKAAQDVGLDSGLVCPNGTLQVIARLTPGSSGDLDGVAELRRWQRAILGDDALLAAVRDEP